MTCIDTQGGIHHILSLIDCHYSPVEENPGWLGVVVPLVARKRCVMDRVRAHQKQLKMSQNPPRQLQNRSQSSSVPLNGTLRGVLVVVVGGDGSQLLLRVHQLSVLLGGAHIQGINTSSILLCKFTQLYNAASTRNMKN